MKETGVLSADSHIVEPADFWTAHIDQKFAERAPRAFVEDDGTVRFVVDGDKPLGSVGAPAQAGVRFENPEDVTFEGSWQDVRPGCSEPVPRLADMARDGIVGEVIFPTLGARLYAVADGELLSACFRAGNDWMMEKFGGDYARMFRPVAILNVQDVSDAVAECERCVAGGLRGAMIPTYAGEDRPYFDPAYDALWAAAQDLDVPLAFHVASCCRGPGQRSIFTSDWEAPDAAAYSATQDYWVRRSLASMIFCGVFERFPGLRVAIVEHELSWLPYFLRQMDVHYTELSQTAPYRFKDHGLPSDFFRTQIFTTFQEDKLGLETLPGLIGTDTLMFGSDYPHAESTWPNSRRFLEELLAGMPGAVKSKLVRANVARLFKFD